MYDRARIAYVDLFFHNMPLLFVLSGLGWSGLLTSAAQKLPARVRFVPAALAVASVGILLVIPAWRLLLHHNRDYAPAVRAWTVAQTRPDFLDGRVALLDASMGALGRSGQPGYLEWLLLPDERWPAPPHEAAPLAVDQQLMADLGLPALDRRAAGLQGLFSKEGADRLERRGFCSLVVLVRRGQVDADGAEIDGAVSALVAQPDWPWTNRAETFFDDANVHGFVLRPPGSAGEP
jgi:hypothetical protein